MIIDWWNWHLQRRGLISFSWRLFKGRSNLFWYYCVLRLVCWGLEAGSGLAVENRMPAQVMAGPESGDTQQVTVSHKTSPCLRGLDAKSVSTDKVITPTLLTIINASSFTLSWKCSGVTAPPHSPTPSRCSSPAPWWRRPRTRARDPRPPSTSRLCSPHRVIPSRRETRNAGTDMELSTAVT